MTCIICCNFFLYHSSETFVFPYFFKSYEKTEQKNLTATCTVNTYKNEVEKISRETAGPAVADYLPSLWSGIGPWGLFIERPGNFSGPKAKVTGIFEKRRGALQAMEGEQRGGGGRVGKGGKQMLALTVVFE